MADIFYHVQSLPLPWQLGEIGREVVDWIHLPGDRVQVKPSVNTGHEVRVPLKADISCAAENPAACKT